MARRTGPVAMVGREDELATLRTALADARGGTTRFVVVGGEAGVGKTRLLSEAAAIAREEGMSVHRGACPPAAAGMQVPFAPFSSVLRSVVRSVDARLVDHLAGTGRQELAVLLPELGEVDPSWTVSSGAARLFEAVLLLLDRAARRTPGMVLLLEDLQWADPAARALLAWLVTELREARIAIVGAYRTQLGPDDPLAPLLVELARAETVDWFELGPLRPEESVLLLERLAGAPLDAARRRDLIRRSGGIPLYLEELAGAPVDGPPPSVRIAVAQRVASLDGEARQVVELLATAAGPVTVALLGAATRRSGEALQRALAAGAEAGLVTLGASAPAELDEVAVRHALIGESIVALAAPHGVAALHAAWADALERSPRAGPRSAVERTAMLARHRLAAGDVPRAVPALVAAAEAAQNARAFAAAHAGYERALELAGEGISDLVPDEVAVLDAAATAAWLAGSTRVALARSEAAAALAGEPFSSVPAARRRVRQAAYRLADGDPTGAVVALEGAIGVLPDGEQRWRALVDLGRALVLVGRAEEAIRWCEEALVGARRDGLPRIASRAAAASAVALSAAGQHAQAVAVLDSARRERDLDATGVVARSRASRLPDAVARDLDEATLRLRDQDPAGSLRAAEHGRAAASARGLGEAFGTILAAVAAWDLVRLGRWSEAGATLASARPDDDAGGAAGPWRSVAAWLAASQGRTGDALGLMRDVDRDALAAMAGPAWAAIAAAAAATAAWSTGGLLEARAAVRSGLRLPLADPAAIVELTLLGLAIEADAVLAAEPRDDLAAAADAREVAAEHEVRARAALDALAPGATDGPTARARWHTMLATRLEGELARVRGASRVAPWEAALGAADVAGEPWSRALARLRLAEALLPGDAERLRAVGLLREAFALADGLGAIPLVGAVERLARRARITLQPGAAGEGPRAAALALGLSEREVDVLALLAIGRTDREIAQELFITEKTAGHHVSHILAKLTVGRRGEAAAVAHRIGLAGLDVEP